MKKIERILVTGGAGFIGSHLAARLLKLGHIVICLDNFDPFYPESIKIKNIAPIRSNKNFILIQRDIRDKQHLENCFKGNRIDLVIHLAAKAGVRPSIDDPLGYYDVNVNGTLILLEVMRTQNVRRLIFASSSSVYGNSPNVPFSETDCVDSTISPYAASKKAGEQICYTYHHLYDFDVFCLRFFTVYGPRQRPDLAINKFTDNIINNAPITVFGDGTSSRDYTYIDDIIDGIIGAVERLKGYEIINLGESRVITLNKMISTLENSLNKTATRNQLPFQEGDVITTYANIQKARILLDYSPKWEFEDGIRKFIQWKLLQ